MSDTADNSFAALYARHARGVHSLCWRLLGDRDQAQDATQETFLAVGRALARFRGESSISTWIHRIAVRTALRMRARRTQNEARTTAAASLGDEPQTDGMSSSERMAVRRAFEQLSFDRQVVLALFAVQGLSHAEIADILGIPEGTVWSRLHTAKKELAQALGPATARSSTPASALHTSRSSR